MTIDELVTRVTADLEAASGPGERREAVARRLAEFFRVPPGDIGIFTYDTSRRQLVLSWPAGLRVAGDIPIDSPNALVAVTARERRTCVENDFTALKHPQFFEHVLPGGRVRRILSVPVLCGDELLGVVQVCRKGSDTRAAGPDFTPDDGAAVEKTAALLTIVARPGSAPL